MKRGWFLLLAISLGLNAGLLYTSLADRAAPLPPVPGPAPGGALPPEMFAPPAGQDSGPDRGPGTPASEALRAWLAHRLERIHGRLALDAQQRERLERVTGEMLPLILAQRAEVHAARSAIRSAYERADLDGPRLHELRRRLSAAQARLDSLVIESLLREAQVLSPEQRRSYLETMPWRMSPGQGLQGERSGRRHGGHTGGHRSPRGNGHGTDRGQSHGQDCGQSRGQTPE